MQFEPWLLAAVVVFGSYVDESPMIKAAANKLYYEDNQLYLVTAHEDSTGEVAERYQCDGSSRLGTIDTRRPSEYDQSTARPSVSGIYLIAPPRKMYILAVYPWSRHAPSCTAPSSSAFRQQSTPAIDCIPQWQ
jgi:hypothetical protein